MHVKNWLLVAGVTLALAGCSDSNEGGEAPWGGDKGGTTSQTDTTEAGSTDDVTLTPPNAEETEEVDPEVLASAVKKMDEGREDDLTIDEEIALSQSMTTTTNQADQLAEQGIDPNQMVGEAVQKLKAGESITDAEAQMVETVANQTQSGELFTLLQKRRHQLEGGKHDKKQITKNVGYGDTISLYEKTHHIKEGAEATGPFHTGSGGEDYYVDDMRINFSEWRKTDPSKQVEFDAEKTKALVKGYLPKDAVFKDLGLDMGNEAQYLELESDGTYSENAIKHVMQFESKQAASRLGNDGLITVDIVVSNIDRNGKSYSKEKFIREVSIHPTHLTTGTQ